jgi:hypothetical protein
MKGEKLLINVSRLLAVIMLFSVFAFTPVPAAAAEGERILVWNGDADKDVALKVEGAANITRGNASGAKITSNANSDDFPGIYFIFDAKQKDKGYLKVDAKVFKKFVSFTVTTKEGSAYTDYLIAPVFGQKKTSDDCYVFFFDNVASARNINMVFIDDAILVPLESVPDPEIMVELNNLIVQAEALKAGSEEFPLQISHTDNGSDVNKGLPWVYASELEGLNNALESARNALIPWAGEAIASLKDAMENFTGKIKADGSDPYFRFDPGPGKVPVKITETTNAWTARTPLDSRVPADFAGGTFKMIPYPFADSEGKADVLQINYVHNGKSTFGGMSIQSPLSPAVNVPEGSTIEFDVYYPKSAQGKYMRWRIRNTNSNLDSYLRDYQYNNLNPDWVGSYNGETWLKAHHSITASTGDSSNFILELHGETSRPAETGMLLVANIKITAPDPNGVALPNVVNSENQSVAAPALRAGVRVEHLLPRQVLDRPCAEALGVLEVPDRL